MKPVKLMHEASYWGLDIKRAEKAYNAKFLGAWALRDADGMWSDEPVDVFYAFNPDTEKGHTHYFGLFERFGELFITGADSAFEEPITGIDNEDGTVTVSRTCHDFVYGKDGAIDGGRDYLKIVGSPKLVRVIQKDGEFFAEEIDDVE